MIQNNGAPPWRGKTQMRLRARCFPTSASSVAEGRIIASGLYAGTGQRQLVPAELWPAAKIDFGACKLSSETFVYNYVTVKRVTEAVETITKKMSARLLERRAQQGDESKKVLQAAMGEEFGKEFTTRAFNDAYGACYERTRGRPKKRK